MFDYLYFLHIYENLHTEFKEREPFELPFFFYVNINRISLVFIIP